MVGCVVCVGLVSPPPNAEIFKRFPPGFNSSSIRYVGFGLGITKRSHYSGSETENEFMASGVTDILNRVILDAFHCSQSMETQIEHIQQTQEPFPDKLDGIISDLSDLKGKLEEANRQLALMKSGAIGAVDAFADKATIMRNLSVLQSADSHDLAELLMLADEATMGLALAELPPARLNLIRQCLPPDGTASK